MKLLYIMLKHKLTTRQAVVIQLLSERGMCASEMGTLAKQNASTLMNAADTLSERKLVRRTKEKFHFFVYRLTESGMNLAKLMHDAELPESTNHKAEDGPLIPGIFS